MISADSIASLLSTDEQVDGCSLEMQERYLRAYCANHQYNIIDVYKENYSAKHHDLQRKIYDELGIEINAIENAIDFATTEWSMLLSMYCGVAHTEDEKISKRTRDGIHGTLLKGKWSGKAPRGYKNVRKSKHDCWIEIDEKEAEKIRQLFHEVALGIETPTSIKNRLYPDLPNSSLFKLLRNRFYAGYVHVPAYGGDPAQDIKGQHEPLVDERTFNEVQNVLDGKRKKQPKLSKPINPMLYLRKFLVCPICGHILTGCASKGNGGIYYYYCCSGDHKHLNMRAEKVNEGFSKYTEALIPHKAIIALYNEILLDSRKEMMKESHGKEEKLQKGKGGEHQPIYSSNR